MTSYLTNTTKTHKETVTKICAKGPNVLLGYSVAVSTALLIAVIYLFLTGNITFPYNPSDQLDSTQQALSEILRIWRPVVIVGYTGILILVISLVLKKVLYKETQIRLLRTGIKIVFSGFLLTFAFALVIMSAAILSVLLGTNNSETLVTKELLIKILWYVFIPLVQIVLVSLLFYFLIQLVRYRTNKDKRISYLLKVITTLIVGIFLPFIVRIGYLFFALVFSWLTLLVAMVIQ